MNMSQLVSFYVVLVWIIQFYGLNKLQVSSLGSCYKAMIKEQGLVFYGFKCAFQLWFSRKNNILFVFGFCSSILFFGLTMGIGF